MLFWYLKYRVFRRSGGNTVLFNENQANTNTVAIDCTNLTVFPGIDHRKKKQHYKAVFWRKWYFKWDIISYSLFADADTRGIAKLRVD